MKKFVQAHLASISASAANQRDDDQQNFNIRTIDDLFYETGDSSLLTDIKRQALLQFAAPMKNCRDMLDIVEHVGDCHTSGCVDIDRLLMGGFFSGQVTEIVGRSASGKSQLCMTAAMACVSANMVNTVIYIDTTNSVQAVRMRQMFLHRKREQEFVGQYLAQHPEMQARLESPFPPVTENTGQVASSFDALSRVYIRHAYTYRELLDTLLQLAKELQSTNRRSRSPCNHLRMVIIDSVASVLGPILSTRDSHQFIVQIGELIRRISKQYHIAFIVTNYTVANISRGSGSSAGTNRGGNSANGGSNSNGNIHTTTTTTNSSSSNSSISSSSSSSSGSLKGALGTSWKRVPDVRLWVHCNDAPGNRIVRTATVKMSCNGPTDGLCQFTIDDSGVRTPLPPFIQKQIDELPLARM